MYGMKGAAAYGRVGVESHVLSASPHKLINMLFDGALRQISAARLHMSEGRIEQKAKAISKALDIVNQGLAAALDKEQGGELAEQLDSLYAYVAGLLLKANLRNDDGLLKEAGDLLGQIGSAWKEIQPEAEGV